MKRLFTSTVGLFAVASTLAAEPLRMTGDAIKDAVTGATIEIDTPVGTKLPLHFADTGQVTGEAAGLAFYLGAERDSGRWWVADDRLCQKWNRWFDAEVQCLELKQDGHRYLWRRDDGKTGTASISVKSRVAMAQPAPQPAEHTRIIAPMPRNLAGVSPAPLPRVAPRTEPMRLAAAPQPAAVVEPKPAERGLRPAAAPPLTEKGKPATAVTAPPMPPARTAISAEPARTAPPVSDGTFRVAGVDAFDVLYVRGGPSADHNAVGAIPPTGRGVRIVGQCRAEWCPVRHRGVDGWVNRYYLVADVPTQRAERRAESDNRKWWNWEAN